MMKMRPNKTIRAMINTMRLSSGLGRIILGHDVSSNAKTLIRLRFLQAGTLALPYGDWLGFLSEEIHAGKKRKLPAVFGKSLPRQEPIWLPMMSLSYYRIMKMEIPVVAPKAGKLTEFMWLRAI